VITGFNTDIEHDGVVYHVQTEDKGLDSPIILSLVYSGGAILASKRSPYKDLIASGFSDEVLSERLKRQHRLICAAIHSGRLNDLKKMSGRVLGAPLEDAVDEVIVEPVERPQVTAPLDIAEIEKPQVTAPLEIVAIEEPVVEPQVVEPLEPAVFEEQIETKEAPSEIEEAPIEVSEFELEEETEEEEDTPPPEFEFEFEPVTTQVWLPPEPLKPLEPLETEEPVEVASDAEPVEELVSEFGEGFEGHTEPYAVHDLRRRGDGGPSGLLINFLDDDELYAGERRTLRVLVSNRKGENEKPIANAPVSIKILGTTFRPLIFTLKTQRDGVASIDTLIPPFTSGRAAVLIRAVVKDQAAELRRVILPHR
jgi:hypothetical protein